MRLPPQAGIQKSPFTSMKRIAFVTTCKSRAQHLKSTLPRNLADNASYANAVFIVLDYSSPDDLLPYLFMNHQQDIESGRLVVYSFLDPSPGPFRMAHAKNMAARCGILEGADILVTLDADNYTGPGFAEFVSDKFAEPGIFLCPDFPLIHSLPHGPTRPMRGYAGRLAIRAQDFIKTGGYDEIFDVWGSEDMDMIFRLQRMGYSMRHIDNGYLNTIPHPAEIRFKEYPEAQKYETKQHVLTIAARTQTVVNYGKFGLGAVRRHPDARTITLAPLPTRVFGIGMHKTATSSLHKAFQAFGFDSFHWGAGEAPLIWQEMKSGRSKTLEQWYALSDNPIPLLYQQLDKAYPGSKFILTIRDEQDWLRSVERLWDYRYNPTRWVWDTYPFTNHIHTVLYGQKYFNAEVFLARYRRHNAEVKEYFKHRPDDLLILDIPASNGWKPLAGFLGKPVPDAPFPWNNNTRQNVFIAAVAEIYSEPATEEEQLAKLFHDTYERLAPSFGYETRKESAVPWEQVPENNRKLMITVAAKIIDTARSRERHHHHHISWLQKLFRWICRWWHRD